MSNDDLPALPPGTPGRPKKEDNRDRFGIILVCPDEDTQRSIYEALTAMRLTKIKVAVA